MTFVRVLDPVVVTKTPPPDNPTIRMLSFCGETPMALMVEARAWLTAGMVTPLFTERYSLLVPK